jgi:hypothetical protein
MARAAAALGAKLGGVAVIRPRDGAVLALAGLAVSAPQPPGSTFKIITLSAALAHGIATPTSTYPIRTFSTLSGVKLRNAHDEACGGSLTRAFTQSCNTAAAIPGVRPNRQPLTRQSGGLERLRVIGDGSHIGHPLTRKFEKPTHRLVELNAACAAPEVDHAKRQKPVLRRIPELLDREVPFPELVVDLCHPPQKAVGAVIRRIGHRGMDHDVGVHNPGVKLPLSGVPALELSADQLLALIDHSSAVFRFHEVSSQTRVPR